MRRCEAGIEGVREDHCLHDHRDGRVCCWCGDLFIREAGGHGAFRPYVRKPPSPTAVRAVQKALGEYTAAWEHVYSLRTAGMPTDEGRAAVTAAGCTLREAVKRLRKKRR